MPIAFALRLPATAAVAVAIALAAAGRSAADQDDSAGPPDPAVLVAQELDELGLTLKAAVASGAMSEADAARVWTTVAERLEARAGLGGARPGGKDTVADGKDARAGRLAPQPGPIRELLRPEFLRRDEGRLAEQLALDGDQRAILAVLLEDHRRAIEFAAAPLRAAIERRAEIERVEAVARAVGEAVPIDRDEAIDRVIAEVRAWRREAKSEAAAAAKSPDARTADARTADVSSAEVETGGKGRDRRGQAGSGDDPAAGKQDAETDDGPDGFAARLVVAAGDLDRRLARLEAQALRRLADLADEGARVSDTDVLRIATVFREERLALEADLRDRLSLIVLVPRGGTVPERDQRAFARAFAFITIARRLGEGRFGGEETDPWAAFAELEGQVGGLPDERAEPVREQLQDAANDAAARLAARTAAVIDREIAGLAWRAERERLRARMLGEATPDLDRLAAATGRFADAARREIDAAVAVRDHLLATTEAVAEALAASGVTEPQVRGFRRAALRRGFPIDGDDLAAERVAAAARRIAKDVPSGSDPDPRADDDLDADARALLAAIDAEAMAEADRLRAAAMAVRLERDPQRARDRIDRLEARSGAPGGDGPSIEDWTALDRRAVAVLDARTLEAVEAVLGPERFARLRASGVRDAADAADAADAGMKKPGPGDAKGTRASLPSGKDAGNEAGKGARKQ